MALLASTVVPLDTDSDNNVIRHTDSNIQNGRRFSVQTN